MAATKPKDYGFRTSIFVPADIEKRIQRERAIYRRKNGYAPSRSAIIIMWIRGMFQDRDSLGDAAQ